MIKDEDFHYLLDTNIVSELFKYQAKYSVVENFTHHSSDMAISIFT